MHSNERDFVKQVWRTMPGYTTFMDAFLRVLHRKAYICSMCLDAIVPDSDLLCWDCAQSKLSGGTIKGEDY